jgi:hypothetical protein
MNKLRIFVQCRGCGITFPIVVNEDDYIDWKSGEGFIQDIMGYLSAGDRELLISNTCSECFNKMFDIDEICIT